MGYDKVCKCQHTQGRVFDDFGVELAESCELCRGAKENPEKRGDDLGPPPESWVSADQRGELGKF